MLTLIAPSSPSGSEALSALIRQEISQAQSLLSFYKNKYGMCSAWPFEAFLHVRDKIFVCLINLFMGIFKIYIHNYLIFFIYIRLSTKFPFLHFARLK